MSENNDLLKKARRSLKKSIVNSEFFKNLGDSLVIPELAEQLKKFSRSTKISLGDFVNVLKDIDQINSTIKKFHKPRMVKPLNTRLTIADEPITQETYGPDVPSEWDSRHAKRLHRQASDYEHDVLPDFSQKLKDLTKKYGSESKAFDVMYKNNPLLKQIAKEMPGLTKAFMKSLPILKTAGAVGGTAIAAWKISEKMQKDFAAEGVSGARAGLTSEMAIAANTALKDSGGSAKSLSGIGQWKKMIGDLMLGGPSDFLKTFAIRGIDVYGSGEGGFATGEEFFTRVTKRIKELRASGQEEKALDLAEKAGIDASIWKEIELAKDGDVLSHINAVGEDTEAWRAARDENRTIRRNRTITKALRSFKGIWSDGSTHFFGKQIRDFIDSVFFPASHAQEAKDIANETAAHSPSASSPIDSAIASASNQFSINIGTMDVNANNPEQLAYGLGAIASSHSNNHSFAVAFDSGLKA